MEGYMGEERIAIFIDGSNLYHALEANFKRHDINFTEFTNRLAGSRKLFRTYYYNILQDQMQWPDTYNEQQDFFGSLYKTPYLEIRLGSTKLEQGIPVEKGVDIMLATDLLNFSFSKLFDIALLVSGDADFAYVLQAVKNRGVHVEVAYFEKSISKGLWSIADNRILLDKEYFKGLWVTKRRSKRKRPKRTKARSIVENNEISY